MAVTSVSRPHAFDDTADDRASTVDSRSSTIRDRWYRDAARSAAGLDDQEEHSSYFGVLKSRSAPPLVGRLLDWVRAAAADRR